LAGMSLRKISAANACETFAQGGAGNGMAAVRPTQRVCSARCTENSWARHGPAGLSEGAPTEAKADPEVHRVFLVGQGVDFALALADGIYIFRYAPFLPRGRPAGRRQAFARPATALH
jgi:hypothetical protein